MHQVCSTGSPLVRFTLVTTGPAARNGVTIQQSSACKGNPGLSGNPECTLQGDVVFGFDSSRVAPMQAGHVKLCRRMQCTVQPMSCMAAGNQGQSCTPLMRARTALALSGAAFAWERACEHYDVPASDTKAASMQA